MPKTPFFPQGFPPQIWLALDPTNNCNVGVRLFSSLDINSPTQLHCNNENRDQCNGLCVDWPYLEVQSNPATFSPQFGGFGQIAVEIELPCGITCSFGCPQGTGFCPGYLELACVEARSTDFDANGITDQTEKITLGQELLKVPASSRNLQYDFNIDGVVDAADYRILCTEMQTEIAQGHPTLYTCDASCETSCAPYAVSGTFVPDLSPPGPVTLSLAGSGSSVTLSWSSPGNDTYNGQQLGVAKEFILRGSPNPITPANFDTATNVTGLPMPDLPGTAEQMTIDACALGVRYLALKTRDYSGNVSDLSNVIAVPPPPTVTVPTASLTPSVGCQGSVSIDFGDATDPLLGPPTYFDVRRSYNAINTDADFATATVLYSGPSNNTIQTTVSCTRRTNLACKALYGTCYWSPMSPSQWVIGNCDPYCDGGGFSARRSLPTALDLSSRPNPATGPIRVEYAVPAEQNGQQLDLAVFDLRGSRVARLDQGSAVPGVHAAVWDGMTADGQRAAPGHYFLRLKCGERSLRRQIILVR
jgi:hypothetical protein